MKIRKYFLILLLITAAFVRLYRIADFTQFRGDQGVAGVVIYEALQHKELPLTGPTVSTGELPGPAYYYLIALPLILSNFNPLVPAIMFALLGVVTVWLLYYVGKNIFGREVGFAIAALYALSPAIMEQNITMWNPTAIPFFVTLVLFSLYKIHEERKPQFLLLASFSVGILVQLHYTNAIWTLWLMIFWLWEFWTKRLQRRQFIACGIKAIFAFLLPLLPFVYYEALHGFVDVKKVLTIVFIPREGIAQTRMLARGLNVIERLFFPVFPLLQKPASYVPFFIVFLPFLRRNFWAMFFSACTLFAVILLSWYKGPFFDHYLWFMQPLPFFLVGFAVSQIPKKFMPVAAAMCILVIEIFYIPRLNLGKIRIGDLDRIRGATDVMLARTPNDPFSFGLISSYSYSDHHYRFFFTLARRNPLPVTDPSYPTLYLLCEGDKCPPFPFLDIGSMKQVRVYCYDAVCHGDYPTIDLTKFYLFHTDKILGGATLYTYKRN